MGPGLPASRRHVPRRPAPASLGLGGAAPPARKPKKPHYIPLPWGKLLQLQMLPVPLHLPGEVPPLYNHMKYSRQGLAVPPSDSPTGPGRRTPGHAPASRGHSQAVPVEPLWPCSWISRPAPRGAGFGPATPDLTHGADVLSQRRQVSSRQGPRAPPRDTTPEAGDMHKGASLRASWLNRGSQGAWGRGVRPWALRSPETSVPAIPAQLLGELPEAQSASTCPC